MCIKINVLWSAHDSPSKPIIVLASHDGWSFEPSREILGIMSQRNLSLADKLLVGADQALRTVFTPSAAGRRKSPAGDTQEKELPEDERRHAAGLMRVNHSGEIAAQALYHGQALTARLDDVRDAMEKAAEEENDHLAWCEKRVSELGSRTSLLNPIWYAGSFALGAVAGLVGDRWSLGFVAETERQVVRHLEEHLERLPKDDVKSRRILEQMKQDEMRHGEAAARAGGRDLPRPLKELMRLTAKIMTQSAYRL